MYQPSFRLADAITQLVLTTVGNPAAQEAIDRFADIAQDELSDEDGDGVGIADAVAKARASAQYKHG